MADRGHICDDDCIQLCRKLTAEGPCLRSPVHDGLCMGRLPNLAGASDDSFAASYKFMREAPPDMPMIIGDPGDCYCGGKEGAHADGCPLDPKKLGAAAPAAPEGSGQ